MSYQEYLGRALVQKVISKKMPNLVKHKQGQTRMSPLGVSGKLKVMRKGQVEFCPPKVNVMCKQAPPYRYLGYPV